MSTIKIKLLTHLHIGSGVFLQNKTEWDTTKDSEGYPIVTVFDDNKIANLIGIDNIPRWASNIERGQSTLDFIKSINPRVDVEKISKRILDPWAPTNKSATLKEFIHDGMGRPYIPGSSIKGAIRTAVLAQTSGDKNFIIGPGNKPTAKSVEKRLFGADANNDVFRTLIVGDAIFGDMYEQVVDMVNINEREKKSYWDISKSQLVEVLPPDDCSSFSLKINPISDTCHKLSMPHVDELSSTETLFSTINAHTLSLLKSEKEWWSQRLEDDDTDRCERYIEEIDRLIAQCEKCVKGEDCILRVGYGSGWRFITGAWTEDRNDFYDVIVPASRPNNKNYQNYDFPKSRRIGTDSKEQDSEIYLLGFVKLTKTT